MGIGRQGNACLNAAHNSAPCVYAGIAALFNAEAQPSASHAPYGCLFNAEAQPGASHAPYGCLMQAKRNIGKHINRDMQGGQTFMIGTFQDTEVTQGCHQFAGNAAIPCFPSLSRLHSTVPAWFWYPAIMHRP